jgi:hypothetical protein
MRSAAWFIIKGNQTAMKKTVHDLGLDVYKESGDPRA